MEVQDKRNAAVLERMLLPRPIAVPLDARQKLFEFAAPEGDYEVVVRNMVNYLYATEGYTMTNLAKQSFEIPAVSTDRPRTTLIVSVAVDAPPSFETASRKR